MTLLFMAADDEIFFSDSVSGEKELRAHEKEEPHPIRERDRQDFFEEHVQ